MIGHRIESARITPSSAEIIFGPGSNDGRSRFAIDENHVVAFAEPTEVRDRINVVDRQIAADVVAAPSGFQNYIVELAVQVYGRVGGQEAVVAVAQIHCPSRRIHASPVRMKSKRILVNRVMLLVIDVEIQRTDDFGSLVFKGHT